MDNIFILFIWVGLAVGILMLADIPKNRREAAKATANKKKATARKKRATANKKREKEWIANSKANTMKAIGAFSSLSKVELDKLKLSYMTTYLSYYNPVMKSSANRIVAEAKDKDTYTHLMGAVLDELVVDEDVSIFIELLELTGKTNCPDIVPTRVVEEHSYDLNILVPDIQQRWYTVSTIPR